MRLKVGCVPSTDSDNPVYFDPKIYLHLAYEREKRMPRIDAGMLFPEWMSKRMENQFIDRWSVE